MNKIAYIFDSFTIYWSPLIIALAAAAGIFLAFGIVILKKQSVQALAVMLPLAVFFSIVFARFIHWYCCTDRYASLWQAFSNFSVGGFSMAGIILGCMLAAVIVRRLGFTENILAFLDCLAPCAALSVAIGRLSFLFNSADRGKVIIENVNYQRLPLGSAVVNTTSGEIQWRFATFFFQSMVAIVILIAVLAVLAAFAGKKYKNGKSAQGVAFVVFCVLYFSSEILLDSTRYDALFLRSNGFVSLMQIFGLVVIVAIAAALCVFSIKAAGFRARLVFMILGVLAGLGLAGYMEYYVQRHGNLYLMCYGIMAVGLAITCASVIAIMMTTIEKRKNCIDTH